jgi:LCP family protein required for cell wall assembly
VYIPGWTMQRINTAMQHGDFEMVQDTFAYNFGVIPDHYILIHLFAFQYVVDNIGGVYVNVGRTITDQREGYGEDYTMRQGVQWMDGETALWYVRARKTSSDFDRTRRQQEVLIAIFNRLASLDGIRRAPELFELYSDNVVTDLGFSDLTSLVGVGARVSDDPDLIETYAVGSADITFFRTNTGASVLLPKRDNITTIIKDALNAR